MSEYRQDPHSGAWVLVAPERGNRRGKHGWRRALMRADRIPVFNAAELDAALQTQELQELGHLLQWATARLRRLSVVPRLVKPGGFELATGLVINPSSPESGAMAVRRDR